MRSLASAFSLGRGGKSTSESPSASVASVSSDLHSVPEYAHRHALAPPRLSKARSIVLSAKAPKTPVETDHPQSRVRPELTPGSSASSDASGSLRTPDDDAATFPTKPPGPNDAERERDKKRWSAWFRRKASSSDKDYSPPAEETSFASGPRPHAGLPASSSLGPSPQGVRRSMSDSDEDDEDSDVSSEYHRQTVQAFSRPLGAVPSQTNLLQAKANFRTLLKNRLLPIVSHPPLVDVSTPTRFPRSSAYHESSQRVPSLESSMHVRRMLQRLERGNLSAADARLIASLGKRKVAARKASDRRFDDDMASFTAMRVGYYSRGLRLWAARPCFEQRFQVWKPEADGQVVSMQVMGVGRGLAVLDLEVSEWLEAMAGLLLDDQSFEETIFPPAPVLRSAPARSVAQFSPLPRPSSQSPRRSSTISAPSPLRLEQGLPAEPVVSTVSSMTSVAPALKPTQPVLASSTSLPSTPKASMRRNSVGQETLRDDKDPYEDVPLAYALQAKKRKEEKERFLQAEREKRAQLASQQRKEQGKQAEMERRRADEERRVREERRKSALAEEVSASRKRIENARLGTESYANIRETNDRERSSARVYSRPAYDSAHASQSSQTRFASLTRFSKSSENLTSRTSPDTSRPPSIAGGSKEGRRQSIVSSGHSPSRMSSESSRPALISHKSLPPESAFSVSRPASVMSGASKRMSLPRVNSMPIPVPVPVMPYQVNPMMSFIPPVPPLPAVMPVWNMSLYPPNAPFMMQQYTRASSPISSRNSPDHSPLRTSTMPLPSSSPSPTRSQQQSAHSPGGVPRSRHQRYYSGEVPRAAPIPADASASSRAQRSASYSPRIPSPAQPRRTTQPAPSNNHHIPDSKRRTTVT